MTAPSHLTPEWPFLDSLRPITPREADERNALIEHFPGDHRGIPLHVLCQQFLVPAHNLLPRALRRHALTAKESQFVALSNATSRNEGRAALEIPWEFAHQMVDLALGRRTHRRIRPLSRGEQGSLLYFLDRLGGDWRRAGGEPFFIRGFLFDDTQVTSYLAGATTYQLTFSFEGPLLNGPLHLWLNDIPTHGNSRRQPLSHSAELVAPWPTTLRLVVGTSQVPIAELRSLRARDLIVLDTLCHSALCHASGEATLVCGDWRLSGGFLDEQHFEIRTVSHVGAAMNPSEPNENQIPVVLNEPSANPLSAMDVTIHIEVGEIALSVARAAALLPGQILHLNRAVGTRVALRVGQRCIGMGELVDHDGDFAVEVTEVL